MLDSSGQRKLGSLISYLQMGVGIIVSLLYTPFMIRALGQSEYGLYNTVASTISMLSVLSLGFNSGYIRFYSRYKEKDDKQSIYKLNGLFLLIFTVIGIVALLCGLFLMNHLDLIFKDGLTAAEYPTARILMLLLTINLALSFPMSVFSNIISANERFVVLKLIGVLKTIGGPLVTLPLLLNGYRSVAVVLVTLLLSLLADILYVFYTFTALEQKFLFHGYEKHIFFNIFAYTGFIAINMIVDQINWNIDKIILTRYRGTTAVAVYSVGYTLYTYYQMLSTAISGVFTPMIHRMVEQTKDDPEKQRSTLTGLFTRVGRIQLYILVLVSSGLLFFGKPFIRFWAGDGYDDAYIVVLLLTIPAIVPLCQNVALEIQRAMNKHRFRSFSYLIMAIINLISSIILSKRFGVIGATIGTAASLIIANGFIMNTYYQLHCNLDVLYFWKNALRVIVGVLPAMLVGAAIQHFVRFSGMLQMVPWVCLYSAAYAVSAWFLSMNDYERQLVKRPFKRIAERRGDA